MRLSTYDKPRIIDCTEQTSRHFGLPRGCLEELQALLSDLRIEFDIRDKRIAGEPLDVTFQGALRPDQQIAARKMLNHDTGGVTAMGKMYEVQPNVVLYAYGDSYESEIRAQFIRITPDGAEPARDMLPTP
jgi:hypothetical protein